MVAIVITTATATEAAAQLGERPPGEAHGAGGDEDGDEENGDDGQHEEHRPRHAEDEVRQGGVLHVAEVAVLVVAELARAALAVLGALLQVAAAAAAASVSSSFLINGIGQNGDEKLLKKEKKKVKRTKSARHCIDERGESGRQEFRTS